MKTITKIKIAVAVLGVTLLMTGCPSTKPIIHDEVLPVSGSIQDQKKPLPPKPRPKPPAPPEKKKPSVTKHVKPLRYFTDVSPSRIVVSVINETKTSDFDAVGRSVTGAIANSGFEVSSKNPYLVVSIRNSLGKLDKLGKSIIYKGKTEITINRTICEYLKNARGINTLLARTKITAKGDRKFDKDDAIDSLADKLAEKSAKWVAKVSKREMAGLSAVIVKFDMNIFRTAFADLDRGVFYDTLERNQPREQIGINLMLKKVAKFPGVLSCVETKRTRKTLTVEFVYRKKDYPHGLVNKGMTEIQEYHQRSLNGRVNELISYLFRK